MIRRSGLAGLIIPLTILCAASPSMAQTGLLEEVTVTATRRAQVIEDIPYNISSFAGDDIEETNVLDSSELLRNFAGVGMVDRGPRSSGTFNAIRMRGLNLEHSGQGDYPVIADATVATYINDTPVFANFLLKDLDRVEVLRGPQGTLYGSGALAGAVRFITKKPDFEEFSGKASASLSKTAGSGGLGLSGDLTLNVPLSDTAAFRVTGSLIDNDGIVDYVNLYQLDANGIPVAPNGILAPDAVFESKEDVDTVDIKFVRASLLWQPSDTFEATLAFAHQTDKIGGRRQTTPNTDGFGREYGRFENGSPVLEPSWRDVDLLSLEAEWDLGFAILGSSSSYYDHSGNAISDNTGFYAQALVWGYIQFLAGGVQVPRPAYQTRRWYGDKAFTQELRLVSTTDGPFDYVVGVYYRDQELSNREEATMLGISRFFASVPAPLVTPPSDLNFNYRSAEDFRDLAAFGELTWHLSDTIQATGGFRYFDNKSEKQVFMDLPFLDSAPPVEPFWETADDDILFKASLSWDIGDDDMLYATVSEGYRRGGTNAIPLSGIYGEDPAWQVYNSDSVINYELGIKGLHDTFRYSASLYYVDWKDPQLNTATPNGGFYAAQNGDGAETKGIELEFAGALGESFNYTLGYAYVDAKLTGDFLAPHNGALIAASGSRLPGSAKHSFNASFDYRTQVGDGMDFTANLSGYYQSSTLGQIDPQTRCFAFSPDGGPEPCYGNKFDGFQIWNASGTLSFKEWEATLWVKNIFNVEGITGTFSEDFSGTMPSVRFFGNSAREMITLPRTIGIRVNYYF